MADEASTIDAALKELASLGRRIAELASTFESRRGGSGAGDERAGAAAKAEADEAGAAGAAAAASPDDARGRGVVADATPSAPPSAAAVRTRDRATIVRREHRSSGAARRRATARVLTADGATPTRGRRQTTRAAPGERTAKRRAWPWRGRPTAPMLVSTALHVAALLVLALVFVARESPPPRLSIVSPASEEEPLDELAEVDIESFEDEAPEPLDAEAPLEPALPDLAALVPEPLVLDAPAAASERPAVDAVDAVDALGSALNVGDLLAVLGDGGGGGGGGGGKNGAAGGGPAPGGTFFGMQGVGRTALFMCDNSASYLDGGFQAVLLELSRAVALMKPDQSFHIVFFSDAAYPLFHPEGIDAFLPATAENKRKCDAWLGTVELCIGGQGIRGAADLALALEPDVVYFLSDGDHADSVIDRMVALPLGDTVVHTFCMQADVRDRRTGLPDPRKLADQQRRDRNLARIAAAHGGTATPVTISPQAALAASVRPVRKNRTRGEVWGMNLPAVP